MRTVGSPILPQSGADASFFNGFSTGADGTAWPSQERGADGSSPLALVFARPPSSEYEAVPAPAIGLYELD